MAHISPALILHNRAVRTVFFHADAIQPGTFPTCKEVAVLVSAAVRPCQTSAAMRLFYLHLFLPFCRCLTFQQTFAETHVHLVCL